MKNPPGFKSTLAISIFTIIFLSGCMGAGALAGMAAVGDVTEKRCSKLDEELEAKKITGAKYRTAMVKNNCRMYLEKFGSK